MTGSPLASLSTARGGLALLIGSYVHVTRNTFKTGRRHARPAHFWLVLELTYCLGQCAGESMPGRLT